MKFTQEKTVPGLMRTIVAAGLMVAGFAALLPGTASALSAKGLTIQVYQVCDDGGNNCAPLGPDGDYYFATEVNKIWAQADISVGFNYVGKINESDWISVDTDAEFEALTGSKGHFKSSTIVDMFLTHGVLGSYGSGWFGEGGIAVNMDLVMSFNGGLGRLDTIAHELGHNFGLVQPSGGMGGDEDRHSAEPNYLMAGGGRLIPSYLADIAPSGYGYDLLPPDQIAYARLSSLLRDIAPVPEPGTYALLTIGLIGLIMFRRRSFVS